MCRLGSVIFPLPHKYAKMSCSSTERFPDAEKHSYSTVCHYANLTVDNAHVRGCLILIKSVLITQSRYGFTILIPDQANISKRFNATLHTWNVKASPHLCFCTIGALGTLASAYSPNLLQHCTAVLDLCLLLSIMLPDFAARPVNVTAMLAMRTRRSGVRLHGLC